MKSPGAAFCPQQPIASASRGNASPRDLYPLDMEGDELPVTRAAHDLIEEHDPGAADFAPERADSADELHDYGGRTVARHRRGNRRADATLMGALLCSAPPRYIPRMHATAPPSEMFAPFVGLANSGQDG